MSRDTFLFLIIGILFGFIAGYWLHEVMTGVQPPRMAPGTGTVSSPDVGGGGPGTAEAAPPGAQAGMQQVEELTAYVEENPDDAQAILRLAQLNMQIANWPRAAELLERVVALGTEAAGIHIDLGYAYRELGRYDDALAQFEQAQEINPDRWESRYYEVIVLAFDLQRMEQAEETLEELRRLQPDNPNVEQLAQQVEAAARGAA